MIHANIPLQEVWVHVQRVGKVETCPDCGKPDIRPALEHEIAEFHSYQQELESRSHA